MRQFLRAKIHRATVTEANLEYMGSVTIDVELMERVDIAPYEKVLIVDNTNGARLETYAIPGPDDSIERGARSFNFVWYRNASGTEFDELMVDNYDVARAATVPPGFLQTHFVNELHGEAGRVLAPPLAEVVRLCPHPFIQAIFDMAAERFVYDRTILLGDAASLVRPHVAAGTAKACADAWALRDHLRDEGDLTSALAAWELEQLAVATSAAERSRSMGESAQVLSTMTPGDPSWRFGLFGPGN